jgi:hypothetical protein
MYTAGKHTAMMVGMHQVVVFTFSGLRKAMACWREWTVMPKQVYNILNTIAKSDDEREARSPTGRSFLVVLSDWRYHQQDAFADWFEAMYLCDADDNGAFVVGAGDRPASLVVGMRLLWWWRWVASKLLHLQETAVTKPHRIKTCDKKKKHKQMYIRCS